MQEEFASTRNVARGYDGLENAGWRPRDGCPDAHALGRHISEGVYNLGSGRPRMTLSLMMDGLGVLYRSSWRVSQ